MPQRIMEGLGFAFHLGAKTEEILGDRQVAGVSRRGRAHSRADGIDLASAGEIDAENKFESVVSEGADFYKKIVLDANRVIGCIMLGGRKRFSADYEADW